MLLTTICFIIGAPVQTVCKSIQSGDLYTEVGQIIYFLDTIFENIYSSVCIYNFGPNTLPTEPLLLFLREAFIYALYTVYCMI